LVGHVTRIGQKRNKYEILVRKPEETTCKRGVEGRIILQYILKKRSVRLD